MSTTHISGRPHQTVMWFAIQKGQIVMTCLQNRVKLRNLENNPRASVLFIGPGCYASVSGKVEIIRDPTLAQQNLELLLKRYTNPEKTAVGQKKLSRDDRVTLQIKPEHYHTHRVKTWLDSVI